MPGADLLLLAPPTARPSGGDPFGLLVTADEPASAEKAIATAKAGGAGLVAVTGGSAARRRVVAELARMRYRLPVAVVGDYDDAVATALVLSGRTDLVAAPVLQIGYSRSWIRLGYDNFC